MRQLKMKVCVAFISLLLIAGCQKKLSYEEMLRVELAKEVRYDSLFYGIQFNMNTSAFMDHCFEMNQKGKFYQYGAGNEVITKLEEDFRYPVDFVFFPNLENNVIQELRGRFFYHNYNPFQKDKGSGELIKEIVRNMEEWYGGRKFFKMPPSDKWLPDIYIKIDGNRKITLEENIVNGEVKVLFEDMKKIDSGN